MITTAEVTAAATTVVVTIMTRGTRGTATHATDVDTFLTERAVV